MMSLPHASPPSNRRNQSHGIDASCFSRTLRIPIRQSLRRPLPTAGGLAFSLIELLVVIAIIAIVTVLAVPAFNHFGKSNLLSAEGNKLVGLITRASQNSVTRNAMTAFVAIPTDPATSTALDAFALFQYAAGDSGWQQITKWETLKPGIVVDPTHLSLTAYPDVKPSPDLPTITFQGSPRPTFQYLVFLPDRSLLQNQSGQISLAEGSFASNSTTPTFTHPGSNGPANFYRITILATTGRTIIERP